MTEIGKMSGTARPHGKHKEQLQLERDIAVMKSALEIAERLSPVTSGLIRSMIEMMESKRG